MATAITGQFPYHFARDTSGPIFRTIYFAWLELNKKNIDSIHQEALDKFKKQTDVKVPERATRDKIDDFLAQDFEKSTEYQVLAKEYQQLQHLDAKTLYPNVAEKNIAAIKEKFKLYLEAQKKAFFVAYEALLEADKKELWKMYEKNLSEILDPVTQFEKRLDPNHLFGEVWAPRYVNAMGKKNQPYASVEDGMTNEKFIPHSQFTDSNGKYINVKYNPKTKKAEEITVYAAAVSTLDWISNVFSGKFTGELGDALAIMMASHGKITPVNIVVPVTGANVISQMESGLIKAIALLLHFIANYFERRSYKNKIKKSIIEKGFLPENIALVGSDGKPIVFSPTLKEKLREEQRAWQNREALLLQPKFASARKEIEEEKAPARRPVPTPA